MLSNQHRPLSSGKMHAAVSARHCLVNQGTSRSESAITADAKGNFPEHDSTCRTCAQDTSNAQARLVALSLLADGRMDSCELELLDGKHGLGGLPLSRTEFFQVLNDFCSAAISMPVSGGSYNIPPAYVEELLDKVTDPSVRRKTLNLMFDVIRSDGQLDPSEAALLWNALDSWGLRVSHLGKAGANLA